MKIGIVLDPIETLSFAAALTTTVQLGTSATIALPQPPVLLARRLATPDRLSGGRVIAGLVQGWMAQEFAVGGVSLERVGDGWDAYVEPYRRRPAPVPGRARGRPCAGRPRRDAGP